MESSALLAWLLGDEAGNRVLEVLRRAALVTASDLALIECDRVLICAVTLGEMDEVMGADRRGLLHRRPPTGTCGKSVQKSLIERGVRSKCQPERRLSVCHATAL